LAVRKPKGRDYWMVDLYDHAGKRIRIKVGRSKKLAETVEAELKLKIAKKEFLGIDDSKKVLFKDFANEYREWAAINHRKNTFAKDQRVTDMLLPIWGNTLVQNINPQMIEQFKAMRNQSIKPRSVNRELCVVYTMFKKAVDWGHLAESPSKKVPMFKVSGGSLRFLRREEADRLLEACRRSECREIYGIVATALHTGMRHQEILHLKWDSVDFKRGVIKVESTDENPTKNYESREIPMSDFVRKVLSKEPRHLGVPYVFPNPDGKKRCYVDHLFQKIRKRAEVEPCRFHDLRHTFASWLVMSGVDLPSVQRLLGHKNIQNTMIYAHLAPEHLKRAVATLDGHHIGTDAFVDGEGARLTA
jgi:integrase